MWKCIRWGVLVVWVVLAMGAPSTFAAEGTQVHGVWKLVSYEVEIQATGQKEPVMGKNPTGYVIFIPEGRVWFVLTGEGRQPAKTVQDRADLLSTVIAYTGTYRSRRRQVDHQGRCGLEPGVGRHGAGTVVQDRRRPASSPHAVAHHAELGGQRNVAEYCDV